MSELDVLVIADYGVDSVSGSHPMKCHLGGRSADIQVVRESLRNSGAETDSTSIETDCSWSSAYSYNGIRLLDHLLKHDLRAALINSFLQDNETFRRLLLKKPKLIVVSTTFILDKDRLQRFHDEVRALSGSIPMIVGGPFVYTSFLVAQRSRETHYQTAEIKAHYLFQDRNDPPFDLYIVSPSGEEIVVEAARNVINGRGLESMAGPSQVADTRPVVVTGPGADKAVLEAVDWHRLPEEIFQSGVVSMQASRGCPFQCAFCNFVKESRLQAVRPVSDIVAEMKAVEARGARYVWFVDDIFRLGHGNLDQFSSEVIRSGINLQWMSFIRADTVKGVDFELLKKAGCLELQLGLESASPEVLNAMNKKADPHIYRQVIEKALSAGINISAYFIFGHPGETESSIDTTLDFIREAQHPELPGAFTWSFYPYLLVPLSPLFEEEKRREFDLRGYMENWSHRTMDSAQAVRQIKKAFMLLQDSGPMYRGDNLRMIEALPVERRKLFYSLRHRCAQRQQKEEVSPQELREQFRPVFEVIIPGTEC